MVPAGYTLFDTALGRCGIAWSTELDTGSGVGADRDTGEVGQEIVVTAVRLPEDSDELTRGFLAHEPALEDHSIESRVPEVQPPAAIARVIAAVTALVDGSNLTDDLTWVQLDTTHLSEFQRSVYAATRRIPPGQTRTYGEIATELGLPGSARAVGRALGDNPFPPIVPCHRVTAARGRTGGFSAGGGVHTKMRMLSTEQAVLGLW